MAATPSLQSAADGTQAFFVLARQVLPWNHIASPSQPLIVVRLSPSLELQNIFCVSCRIAYLPSAPPPNPQSLAYSDSVRLGWCICHVVPSCCILLCGASSLPVLILWGSRQVGPTQCLSLALDSLTLPPGHCERKLSLKIGDTDLRQFQACVLEAPTRQASALSTLKAHGGSRPTPAAEGSLVEGWWLPELVLLPLQGLAPCSPDLTPSSVPCPPFLETSLYF